MNFAQWCHLKRKQQKKNQIKRSAVEWMEHLSVDEKLTVSYIHNLFIYRIDGLSAIVVARNSSQLHTYSIQKIHRTNSEAENRDQLNVLLAFRYRIVKKYCSVINPSTSTIYLFIVSCTMLSELTFASLLTRAVAEIFKQKWWKMAVTLTVYACVALSPLLKAKRKRVCTQNTFNNPSNEIMIYI